MDVVQEPPAVAWERLAGLRLAVPDASAAAQSWQRLLGLPSREVGYGAHRIDLGSAWLELSDQGDEIPRIEVAIEAGGSAVTFDRVRSRASATGDEGVALDPGYFNGVHLRVVESASPSESDRPDQQPPEPSVFCGVSHVVVAVRDAEAALQGWQGVVGTWPVGPGHTAEHAHHVPIGDAWFGLTSSGTDADALGRFLDTRGEGIYAIGLRVSDREAAREHLLGAGGRLIEAPTGQCFLHPASTHGFLVDIVERPLR